MPIPAFPKSNRAADLRKAQSRGGDTPQPARASRVASARQALAHVTGGDRTGENRTGTGNQPEERLQRSLSAVNAYFHKLLPEIVALPAYQEKRQEIDSLITSANKYIEEQKLADARLATSLLGKFVLENKNKPTLSQLESANELLEYYAEGFHGKENKILLVESGGFDSVCHDYTVSEDNNIFNINREKSHLDLILDYASCGSRVVVFFIGDNLCHSGRFDGKAMTHFLFSNEMQKGVVLETVLDAEDDYGYQRRFILPDEAPEMQRHLSQCGQKREESEDDD